MSQQEVLGSHTARVMPHRTFRFPKSAGDLPRMFTLGFRRLPCSAARSIGAGCPVTPPRANPSHHNKQISINTAQPKAQSWPSWGDNLISR